MGQLLYTLIIQNGQQSGLRNLNQSLVSSGHKQLQDGQICMHETQYAIPRE